MGVVSAGQLRAPLWPRELDIQVGFTDSELEELARPRGALGRIRERENPGPFWTTEIYGQGRGLREWLSLPFFVPLPFYADHGVNHSVAWEDHELTNMASLHLTWSGWRAQQVAPAGKRVLWIQHPFVSYRTARGIEGLGGTHEILVFVPHELPGHEYPEYSWERFIEEVEQEVGPPTALMLAMHDINKGSHLRLRRLGLPIITAGNTRTPLFLDRFYDVVGRFGHAVSNSVGTQQYLCHELGMEYSILGKPREFPETVRRLAPATPIGEAAYQAFHVDSSISRSGKQSFVEQAIGLGRDDDFLRDEVRERYFANLATVLGRYCSKRLRSSFNW